MATNNCGTSNCGCTNTYTVTAPCPPSCPEVFNASCIVYTGTDILCNQDTVISRYDYLDTVITKLVNYICSVQAPVTVVAGSTYIDVVQNTVGNVTTYTVSVDIPTLQAYFDIIIAQTIGASILAGAGINVNVNPITNAVTVSHADTSAVTDINSNNTGNTFIQDVFFTFDTFGHVTGASVVPASIIEASLTSAGGTESLVNDGVGPTLATKGLTAGAGISLSATGTDITITNTSTGAAVTLADAGTATHESLVNDGVGPALATKGLKAGTGISLSATGTDITITNTLTLQKYTTLSANPFGAVPVTFTHGLNTDSIVVACHYVSTGIAPTYGTDYGYSISNVNQILITPVSGTFQTAEIRITVIG